MEFQWTAEQLAFHECKAPRIRVKAFAGASKTTSLEGYTKRYPRLRFLYVAYNRSIADEGKARFPSNVKCMTSHQLAFKAVGRQFQHKLGASLRPADILSTAHRSKGLEWTHVYLGEDYPDPLDPELAPDARRDELNLLYVAATRAKHQLAINSVILGIMRDFERSRRRAIELAEAAD